MKARLGLASVAGCAAAALAYALVRVVQKLLIEEPDPTTVLWAGEHSGFFWRAWTAAYAGGAVAIVAWMLAARSPDRLAAFLARAVVPVAIALALQAALVP